MWKQDLMILAGAEWWETLYSLVELGEILDSLEDYREFFRSLSLSLICYHTAKF